MENHMSSSNQLQCIGKLEISKSKPVGFICGTLPVPIDKFFHSFQSELVPSSHTITAPRYRMLPTETDLNLPPLHFPSISQQTGGNSHLETDHINYDLSRKCETLAVSGLAEHGDELDVVAPSDILKQIFKIPYSKARVSVAVHRIGQTLVLNTGPDVEEGEKLFRRRGKQKKGVDQSLFLNFAMHSVRVEACDCPPGTPCEDPSTSNVSHGQYNHGEKYPSRGNVSKFLDESDSDCEEENVFLGSKKNRKRDTQKQSSQIGEKSRGSVQESEKYRRLGNDGFVRVLFWQFHNFRMLLGSDLLLFSNEKYVAVSLHLWDVARQVTPLTWLEAWLDNVMAKVPELAICYHQNGVVQGYELLKTDDIFLLKGISEDGTPAFHPHVVQQNGLSVLRFLQDNCKQDPGAYWLYKHAGEDVIQLFDLSVLPKNHSSEDHDQNCNPLPSGLHKGRSDSLFSLGRLLYRLAHRLSLSEASANRAKCARLFRKCLDFLNEQDHLVVRAYAHEQFARLILNCYEELDLTSESLLLESEVIVTDVEDESAGYTVELSEPVYQDELPPQVTVKPLSKAESTAQESAIDTSEKMDLKTKMPCSTDNFLGVGLELEDAKGSVLEDSPISTDPPHVVHTISDPISSRLAAIHHVSQAIKTLRWKRQLQNAEMSPMNNGNRNHDRSAHTQSSVCACGDVDCIEVCDIREWIAKSKLDQKMWKLVLLLGESYLYLGQAYKENGQWEKTLKVVELACSLYGSMPHLENGQYISSMSSSCLPQIIPKYRGSKGNLVLGETKEVSVLNKESVSANEESSNSLFWAKAWTLVGDVFSEYHRIKGKENALRAERKIPAYDVRVSSTVAKEVKRLKKKLGQFKQNCTTCSLLNCSCQSDRANSGNSASSSVGDNYSSVYGRRHSRKPKAKPYIPTFHGLQEEKHLVHSAENNNGLLEKQLENRTSGNHKVGGDTLDVPRKGPGKELPKVKYGGIFKFLEGPVIGDVEYNLCAAIDCYDSARKAISELSFSSVDVQSIVKKKGWACNELGRHRLDNKDLDDAECAFVSAIKAFKEVGDYTNIILINCNLGHGRRALAESVVAKLEMNTRHGPFHNAYMEDLKAAKTGYCRALRYYCAAKSELDAVKDDFDLGIPILRNEVYTQVAHTYLKLGMFLAREGISTEVYQHEDLEEVSKSYDHSSHERIRKPIIREISANDALREALCIYESLGELRKQEVAYAYFQLACHQRDCCLKFLELEEKVIELAREANHLQKAKWYASLADRNWLKAIDFYGPKTHPVMYLSILMERSALSLRLSSSFHSVQMLESSLSYLLEGRHVTEATEIYHKPSFPRSKNSGFNSRHY